MIGERIKALRKKLGISQAEFASKLDVSQPIVVAWENGSKSPSAESVARLCKAFSLEPAYLYTPLPYDEKELDGFIEDFRSLQRADQELLHAVMRKLVIVQRIGSAQ